MTQISRVNTRVVRRVRRLDMSGTSREWLIEDGDDSHEVAIVAHAKNTGRKRAISWKQLNRCKAVLACSTASILKHVRQLRILLFPADGSSRHAKVFLK